MMTDTQAMLKVLVGKWKRLESTRVYLIPGHSPTYPNIHLSGTNEFSENVSLCELIANKLIGPEIVFQTVDGPLRETGESKSYLEKRVALANKIETASPRTSLFVEIHFNAYSKATANGAEVFCFKPDSKAAEAARFVLMRLGKYFVPRGVKYQNFYVLRHTTMPAILVEVCFTTNNDDWATYQDFKPMIAADIAQGIIDYMALRIGI